MPSVSPPRYRTTPDGSVLVAEAFAGPALRSQGEQAMLAMIEARLDSINTANGTRVELYSIWVTGSPAVR